MFRIRLLGEFEMVSQEAEAPLALRRYDRLFAYLAVRHPEPVMRKSLLMQLYPEASVETAANRLRVALTGFQRQWGDLLLRDHRCLQLNPERVRIDLHDVQQEAKRVAGLLDEEDELAGWLALAPQLGRALLPSWSEDWLAPEQSSWDGWARDQLLHAAEMAVERQHSEAAETLAATALHRDRFSETAWRIYGAQAARNGRGRKAGEEFAKARRHLRHEFDLDFSESLVTEMELAGLDGFAPAMEDSAPHSWVEAEALSRSILTALERKPGVAGVLMAMPEFYTEACIAPKRFMRLLERALEVLPVSDESWPGCCMNWIALRLHLGARIEVIGELQHLLTVATDPRTRSRGLSALAVAHMCENRLHLAEQALKQVQQEMKAAGLDHHFYLNLRDVANLHVLRGENQAALQVYQRALVFFEGREDRESGLARGSLSYGLATAYFMQKQYQAAEEPIRRSMHEFHRYAHHGSFAAYVPFSGLVLYRAGHRQEGVHALADSLRLVYRKGLYRAQQASLNYAALILADLGQVGLARDISGYELAWRARTQSPRTAFQTALMRDVEVTPSSALPPELDVRLSPAAVLKRVYERLKKLTV
jgi:DNA-binding SARP family transcriptional activator